MGVSTLRTLDANLHVLGALRDHGYEGRVAVSADTEEHEDQLLEAGVHVTIRPLHVAAGPLLARLHEHS